MKPTVIEPMAVARLRPFPGNARTHSRKQFRRLTGRDATLAASRQSFATVAAQRKAETAR
jgi:hypothetical protein